MSDVWALIDCWHIVAANGAFTVCGLDLSEHDVLCCGELLTDGPYCSTCLRIAKVNPPS